MKLVSQQFKVSVKAFCSSTDHALLRKAFTDIVNCCDIHFTYILFKFVFLRKKIVDFSILLFENFIYANYLSAQL